MLAHFKMFNEEKDHFQMRIYHKKRYNSPKLQDAEAFNVAEGYFYTFSNSKNILLSLPRCLSFFKGGKK